MAKQKVKNTQVHNHPQPAPVIEEKSRFSFFMDFKFQAVLLTVIGFIFYANSFYNEYCLDDGIVIEKNEYVQQGFGGIWKILTTDAYDSFYRQMGAEQELAGGRYRPLSIVTFAIEEALFGSGEKDKEPGDLAFIRHVLNVVFYIFSILVLLYFLRNFLFKNLPLVAFLTCLFFLIHPIHTEVVSNVKSRDEILSFLFVILTFIFALRYRENKMVKSSLFYGLFFYFLALLSKEYAITLLILIPMLLYIYSKDELQESFIATLPYFAVAILYLYIRFSIVGVGKTEGNVDVLNSPFKWATNSEKWATKFEILMRYLKLLFYPHPLSSDYSFKTIPYSNFGDGIVWVSVVLHITAIVATVKLFFKRNILAFALAFYLGHLALVANFLMEIGATMGERLVYNSSFGLAMILAVGFDSGLKKLKDEKLRIGLGIAIISIITIWCGEKTIKRNRDWKRDSVLFIADAKTVPNSVLVNGNAGKAYMDLSEKPENKAKEKEFIDKAIYHLNRAISLHPTYVNGYLNLGVAYYKLEQFEKAQEMWDKVKILYPNNPYLVTNYRALGSVYYQKAIAVGKTEPLEVPRLKEAIKLLEKAVAVQPQNATYWYDLGGVSYMIGDFEKARISWENSIKLDPTNEKAQKGLAALPK